MDEKNGDISASKTSESDSGTNSTHSNVSSSNEENTSNSNKRTVVENEDSGRGDNDDEASKKKKKKDVEPVKEVPPKPVQARSGFIAGSKIPGPASKTGVAPLSKGGGPLASAGVKAGFNGQKATPGSQKSSAGTQSSVKIVSSVSTKTGSVQNASQGSKVVSKSASTTSGAQIAGKNVEKKTVAVSVKPVSVVSKEADVEGDDAKSGMKVPPLKIVIPGGISSGTGIQQDEGGSAQRGAAKTRGGSATLPYIIHPAEPNGESNETSDKDDKRQGNGSDDKLGQGQRVLRSHRNTDGPEKDKEKGIASPHSVSNPPVCSSNNNSSLMPSKIPVTSQSSDSSDRDGSCTSSSSSSSNSRSSVSGPSVSIAPATSSSDLHPRKRKLKAQKESHEKPVTTESTQVSSSVADAASHNSLPFANPYQTYIDIRKQVNSRQKNLFPVQPKPPQGFDGYLVNRRTYVLHSNPKIQPEIVFPENLPAQMKDEFIAQENDRHNFRVQHLVEKEKLILAVEQEILRVHGRAARSLANQAMPFSVCTMLRDRDVYDMPTAEQEEKDRNAQRPRYTGRIFLSWLQDLDDKWEKTKDEMVRRHHMEADALHATQTMNWEWKLEEMGVSDFRLALPVDPSHVPKVHVSDDFDLLIT